MKADLTGRQAREIEYHAHRAALLKNRTVYYDVLTRQKVKWWSHY